MTTRKPSAWNGEIENTNSKESKATPNIDANENKNESIVSTLDNLYKIENKENVAKNEKEILNVTKIEEKIKEEKPIVQKTIEQKVKNTKPPVSDIVNKPKEENKPKENFLNNVEFVRVFRLYIGCSLVSIFLFCVLDSSYLLSLVLGSYMQKAFAVLVRSMRLPLLRLSHTFFW